MTEELPGLEGIPGSGYRSPPCWRRPTSFAAPNACTRCCGRAACRSAGTARAPPRCPDPALKRWARRIAHQHGYVDVAQTIELFGTCAECSAQGEI